MIAGLVMVLLPMYEYREQVYELVKRIGRPKTESDRGTEYRPETSQTTCHTDRASQGMRMTGTNRGGKGGKGLIFEGGNKYGITLVARLPGMGRPSGESSSRWRPSMESNRSG